jgi:hypothetical protein
MRLAGVNIVNFRCLRDLKLEFDDVTVLVGANSTGKSSVLHALGWLFHGYPLHPEDVWGSENDATVAVSATFTDFNDADRQVLGSYVINETATFTASAAAGEPPKLTGRARSFRPFEEVREHQKATPMREAWATLLADRPELGLPKWSNQQAMIDFMKAWEADHPDDLEESTVSATHLFGFTGEGRLNQRFDFVLVPAVSDPESETQDARGTLLRQLLDRAMGDQAPMQERLKQLEERVAEQLQEIAGDEAGESLRRLSLSVSAELQRLVPGGAVRLEPRAPALKMPDLSVGLRVEEGGLETEVGRQGHGFQRALLIAVVQQLAVLSRQPEPEDEEAESVVPAESQLDLDGGKPPTGPGDPPALFLAIEEPELYQHPSQARHFAATLSKLAEGAGVQVAYATHSEHFVDPSRYERLRRFRRSTGALLPTGEATRATVAQVTELLDGIVDPGQVEIRIRMTLRRQLAAAVFARAVLIGEGPTDGGFLQGIADRTGGLDADGIAVVFGMGKAQLPLPWAILRSLDIPTYAVFDGDAGLADRMRGEGKDEAKIDGAVAHSTRANRTLLRLLGAEEEDQPETSVHATYAVFRDRLEAEALAWGACAEALTRCETELGDWRRKSDDVYRMAAGTADGDPPRIFTDVIDALRAMT